MHCDLHTCFGSNEIYKSTNAAEIKVEISGFIKAIGQFKKFKIVDNVRHTPMNFNPGPFNNIIS